MRTLVIGAKGFVGAALVRSLLAAGHDVTALELRSTPGRLADVADLIEWVAGDGSSPEAILAAIGGRAVDAIYYGPYYRTPPEMPGLDRELDVMAAGAWRTFQLARALPGLRVVFPSSIAVHGPQPIDGSPLNETTRVQPFGLYGAGKLMTEQVAIQINDALGRRAITCVRLPSVYGPGAETASRGVNVPAVCAARGLPAAVAYTPDTRVCVGHVDDVADALRRIIESPDPEHDVYESGGLDASFGEIAAAVRSIVPSAVITYGDDAHQVLPNLVEWGRLRSEFGASHRDLAAGMRSVIDYERATARS